VIGARTDSDQDAIRLRVAVARSGASCHVGYRSCFYRAVPVGSEAGGALRFTEETRAFDPAALYGDAPNRLCCTDPARDSSRESSVVDGLHEQTRTPDRQDPELAGLSSHRGAIGSSPMAREALKRRGLLTIWFDPAMTWDAAPSGKRGRQQTFSDAAIQTCLTMKGEGRPEAGPVDRFQP
jgi:hypothetical protein